MGMSSGGSDGMQSEINVTPLVDVVLVLLIIFMVIVPLTMRGYDMAIPGEATAAPAAERELEQIVLAIDPGGCPLVGPPQAEGLPAGCNVRLNDDTLAATELSAAVAAAFAERAEPDRVLFLAAHDRLNYEAVMRVVDLARSGVEGLRIGMVTEREPDSPAL